MQATCVRREDPHGALDRPHDGVRLLSPTTVQLATVNHVGALFRETSGFGLGFGYMIAGAMHRTGPGSAVAAPRWSGVRLPKLGCWSWRAISRAR